MNAPFAPPGPEAPLPSAQMLPPLAERREVRKAVILAAGRGRRMGKLTTDRPKGALDIGGHALIDWQIEALRAAGVKEIAVVTGHAPEALAGRDVTYIHNPDWAKGTQVETLLKATDWIAGEPAIVSYSDIIYHPCAALALLERPGDIVVAYDADHRWLWKRRFGSWLRDSETFKLGPGQVLAEIGGKPSDIEELDGQFMGLMLLTRPGFDRLARRFAAIPPDGKRTADFTSLLSLLLTSGVRIDTAANLLPWMEVDCARDVEIARKMSARCDIRDLDPQLVFPSGFLDERPPDDHHNVANETTEPAGELSPLHCSEVEGQPVPGSFTEIQSYTVEGAFAVQNWGRSGSTFLQSLFDDHPQVLATPNFYSRHFFSAWSARIGLLPDSEKIEAFLTDFRQWWDSGYVDASAGLHRLGDGRNQIAGVNRQRLEGFLRVALPEGQPITRRRMFEAGHLAYALARGQALSGVGLQILFPVHGEPRSVAAALLEDYPNARFLHTIREPVANIASSIEHIKSNALDSQVDALGSSLLMLFGRVSSRFYQTFSMFNDREYFRWLALHDRARAIRLEDLRNDGINLMRRVAGWLDLEEDVRMGSSTWDGKTWWNRPESGSDRPPRPMTTFDNMEGLLCDADKEIIKDLSRCSPLLQAAYPVKARRWRLVRLIYIVGHLWRFETKSRPSLLQCLLATRALRLASKSVGTSRLDEQIRREFERARLLCMSHGSGMLRRRLSDVTKSSTIRAILILSPMGNQWRLRSISKLCSELVEASDRLHVVFLDEAIQEDSVKDHLRWVFVRTVGALVVRIRALWRVRRVILGTALRPKPQFGTAMKLLQ